TGLGGVGGVPKTEARRRSHRRPVTHVRGSRPAVQLGLRPGAADHRTPPATQLRDRGAPGREPVRPALLAARQTIRGGRGVSDRQANETVRYRKPLELRRLGRRHAIVEASAGTGKTYILEHL